MESSVPTVNRRAAAGPRRGAVARSAVVGWVSLEAAFLWPSWPYVG